MPPRECTVHSCPNVKELLSQNSRKVSSLSDCNGARTQKHLVRKRTLNPLSKMAKWLNCVASSYLYSAFDCLFLSCHEHFSGWTTLYSFLTVKELLARNRPKIWSLNDCNGIRIQNNLVRQLTLDHLAKLDKWFGCVASSYLYSGFDCIFLIMWYMVYAFQSESTLYSSPNVKEMFCSKQAQNMKFKWLQRDSNPRPFSSSTNTQPFCQTGQMIQLCCEYLSVRCIWL